MAGKADLPSGKHNKGHLPHCFAPSCHAAGGSKRPFSAYISYTFFTLKRVREREREGKRKRERNCCSMQTSTNVCMLNLLRTCHPALSRTPLAHPRTCQFNALFSHCPQKYATYLFSMVFYTFSPSWLFYLISLMSVIDYKFNFYIFNVGIQWHTLY